MLFTIVSAIVLVVGIGMAKYGASESEDGWMGLGVCGISIGILSLVISIAIIISTSYENRTAHISYEQDKAYILSLKSNTQFTDSERTNAINKVIEINNDINTVRLMKDDLWFGAFYPSAKASFDLIDINLIPPAKYEVGITRSN